jgi:hypothetical protein
VQVALIAGALALAGCNQVYSLDSTQLRDGASPDAPYSCTTEAPRFRGTPVPVIVNGTNDLARTYSISLDRRIALVTRANTLWEGPGDSNMLREAMLMPIPLTGTLGMSRLAPEGDELFMAEPDGAVSSTVYRYARSGDLWARQPSTFIVGGATPEISIPTRRDLDPRHIVIAVGNMLREYIETAPDVWMLTSMYTPADFGVTGIQVPNLTADGLRLMFAAPGVADGALYYASRDTITGRFGSAEAANPFFGNPRVLDPYLLEDCSRLYFFVVANPAGVFYVERD